MSRTLPIAPNPAPDREGGPGGFELLGALPEELAGWLEAAGEPRFRAAQILDWVYAKRAATYDDMSNLPRKLRLRLAGEAPLYRGTVTRRSDSTDGTRKLLLSWPDGETTETVWIPDDPRHTVCLSSQAGCPAGCRFCASGLDGLKRNLTAGEIVEQALRVARMVAEADPVDGRLSNVVLMGMGEPLANYKNAVRAIRILNAPWGLGVGARHITLSTVGLPEQIRKLAGEGLPINLALSLHAVDDALRHELVPWNRRVRIADLIDAGRHYFEATGREVTLEYVLLDGVNDLPLHAERLAVIARRLRANVNLLRYNPVAGLPYRRPSAESAFAFQRRLRDVGVNAHIRRSRGSDVDAACGQLRRAAAAPLLGGS